MDFSLLLLPLGAIPSFALGFMFGLRRCKRGAVGAPEFQDDLSGPSEHEYHISGKQGTRVTEECAHCGRKRLQPLEMNVGR